MTIYPSCKVVVHHPMTIKTYIHTYVHVYTYKIHSEETISDVGGLWKGWKCLILGMCWESQEFVPLKEGVLGVTRVCPSKQRVGYHWKLHHNHSLSMVTSLFQTFLWASFLLLSSTNSIIFSVVLSLFDLFIYFFLEVYGWFY